jgi:hypothetical protein
LKRVLATPAPMAVFQVLHFRSNFLHFGSSGAHFHSNPNRQRQSWFNGAGNRSSSGGWGACVARWSILQVLAPFDWK